MTDGMQTNNDLPRLDLHLAARMLRSGVPVAVVDRICLTNLRREWLSPDAHTRALVAAVAQLLVSGPTRPEAAEELLASWLLTRGTPLPAEEVARIVADAGEPDVPRRVVFPIELDVRATGTGWGSVVLRGTDDPAAAEETVHRLAAYLLRRQVDPILGAALCIVWAWAGLDVPLPPGDVLNAVLAAAAWVEVA